MEEGEVVESTRCARDMNSTTYLFFQPFSCLAESLNISANSRLYRGQ